MSIISRLYSKAGEMYGQVLIQEHGTATDDDNSLRELRLYETGRVEILPLPRTTGLVVKALVGQTIRLNTIDTELFGRWTNMLQIDRTTIQQLAPTQPFGVANGRKVISYSRLWLHTGE